MSTFKNLAGQTATYGLSSILGRFLNYLLVPLYTRVFHAGEYGLVTQLFAYVAFLNILFTYGLETSYFRFFQAEKGSPKVYASALISILTSSLFFGILIAIFSTPIARFLQQDGSSNDHHLPLYVIWLGITLASDAIAAIPFARLRQQNKAKRFATLRILNILINVLLNLYFLLLCPYLVEHGSSPLFYTPSLGVGYVFLSTLISSVATLLMLAPEFAGIHFEFDSKLWKKMLHYAFPLMIAGFAGMINETFDRVLLPILLPDKSTAMEQLGVYGACYKLSILITLFVQTFRYAAEPFFFRQADEPNARETFSKVMNYFVLACSLIFLGVMMYIDIIKFLIGKEYRSGLGIVPILLMANLFLGVYYNLSLWYKLTGKTRWGAFFSIIGAIITLVFNFWLIPIMGYAGAAWATLICYGSMMVIAYLTGQKFYPVPYDVKRFFIYTISAVVIFLISDFIRYQFEPGVATILFINTILFLAYLGFAWKYERGKKSTFALNFLRKKKEN